MSQKLKIIKEKFDKGSFTDQITLFLSNNVKIVFVMDDKYAAFSIDDGIDHNPYWNVVKVIPILHLAMIIRHAKLFNEYMQINKNCKKSESKEDDKLIFEYGMFAVTDQKNRLNRFFPLIKP